MRDVVLTRVSIDSMYFLLHSWEPRLNALILVTNKLMSTNVKRMSVTTKIILAAKEVITTTSKVTQPI